MIRRSLIALGVAVAGLVALPAVASAGEEILPAVEYDDATTFSCRTGAIPINPGQNLNLFGWDPDLPQRGKVGDGPASASDFNTSTQGYITRFKPSMVEITGRGRLSRPASMTFTSTTSSGSRDGGPTFASGEEKTEVKLPQGYGIQTAANAGWALNYMIHSLNASGGREVSITWEIDWVPVSSPTPAHRYRARRRSNGWTSRALPRALSGLRCRAGL